jgi:Nucleotidyl transferase AbiEii toxin, Type IV TA system
VDRDELMRLLRAFEAEGLDYVIIGATAMGFHGVIRATEDVDLIVRPTAANIERLRRALRAVYGQDESIEEIRDVDLLGEYPSVRYYPPSGDLFLDVMTRLGEAASYESVQSETREVDGVRVHVATPHALYRLKKDTLRPLDRRDAAVLAERFNLKDDD